MSQLAGKHRPPSLDISAATGDHSDVALRIVSPGLPQLSSEMKNTIRKSNEIQMQQKTLIAARQGHLGDGHDDDDGDEAADVPETQPAPPLPPKTTTSLKRSHVPAPLDISGTHGAAPVLIHSAPMRYNRMARTTPMNKNVFLTHLTPHRSYSPYTGHFPKRVRLVPHAAPGVPLYKRSAYQPHTPQPAARFGGPYTAGVTPKVVDVFSDNLVRGAPLKSQPLSAQREYFFEEDRLPASEAELREMEEKHKTSDSEVFGCINFMNTTMSNFRIFSDKTPTNREKEKFMEICSKTWDQFAQTRTTN